jgi:hypothetical protein
MVACLTEFNPCMVACLTEFNPCMVACLTEFNPCMVLAKWYFLRISTHVKDMTIYDIQNVP